MPERPESLPECMSTSTTRATPRMTCRPDRIWESRCVDTAGQCTSGPSAGLTRHDLPVSSVDALAVIALTVVAVWLVGSCVHSRAGAAERMLAGVLALLGPAWGGMLASTLGLAVPGPDAGFRTRT